jgi:hypothetical protein
MELNSSQWGSNGCTSVITSTSLSCATPNEHSVRKVPLAFAKLLPGDADGRWLYVREKTRRGEESFELPATALLLPLLGWRRALRGCRASGRPPELLTLDGESSSSKSEMKWVRLVTQKG